MSTEDMMDVISTLTSTLTSLQRDHKSDGGPSQVGDGDVHGLRIITMAGNNTGATLKGFPNEKGQQQPALDDEVDADEAPLEGATLVNSNLQAINNSIMLGTKYKSHDPGVHVDISEDLDLEYYRRRKGWKGKKKEGCPSSSSESDSHSSGAEGH